MFRGIGYEEVARLFPAARQPRSTRIGAEQELLTFDHATGAPASVRRLQHLVAIAGLDSVVTFEPGGQVELNVPCTASGTDLARRVEHDTHRLRQVCTAAGVDLRALPVDPRGSREVPMQLHTPRYVAMRAHFDRQGPSGAAMMCRTAATQVCLDWWPGTTGHEQWRVLLLAAPFLAARFARSCGPDSRLAIWLGVEPCRTAFDDRLLYGDDPVAAYLDFAQHASPLQHDSTAVEHLTTLFPPVRPRGRYLEVRFPDVQEGPGLRLLPVVLARLMYDVPLRRDVLRTLEPESGRLAEHWRLSADGDASTRALGDDLTRRAVRRARLSAAPPTEGTPAPEVLS